MISTSLEDDATEQVAPGSVQGQEKTVLMAPLERLLLSPDEAAAILCVSRATLYRILEFGQLRAVHVGRSRRIRRRDLEDFVDRLEWGVTTADREGNR